MRFPNLSKWWQYLFKHILIFLAVVFVGTISFLYHSSLNKIVPVLYGVITDLVIAFIPAAIAISNVIKNFKNKIIDIYTLKEKIKYLRFEIRDLILDKNQDRIQLMLHPSIINEIRDLLRKFEFFHDANIINAFIEQKLLYQIDDLLIRVMKLTREYDRGKEWKKIQNECGEALRQLRDVRDFNFPNVELKKKFIENLDWVLAYELFFKREGKYPVNVYYGPL